MTEQQLAEQLDAFIDNELNCCICNTNNTIHKLKIQSNCQLMNIEFSVVLTKTQKKDNNIEITDYSSNMVLSTPQFS